MRKIAVGLLAAITTLSFSTPAIANPLDAMRLLDTNYPANVDCGSLNATLTSLNLVTGPTTKSQLATKVKTNGATLLGGFNIGGDSQLIVNKAAVDVSNRALECGIVQEDPKIMGSIELPQPLEDLRLLLSA